MASSVGVDIGTRTITVAEVKQSGGQTQITNFGGVELPVDAVREGEILDVAVVAEQLKELFKTAKIGRAHV